MGTRCGSLRSAMTRARASGSTRGPTGPDRSALTTAHLALRDRAHPRQTYNRVRANARTLLALSKEGPDSAGSLGDFYGCPNVAKRSSSGVVMVTRFWRLTT